MVEAEFVIEVGVWKGSSSVLLAQMLKDRGRGVVLSVDSWLGSVENWQKDVERKDLLLHHGNPTMYYTFVSNVVQKGLTEYVVPFPIPSNGAAQYLVENKLQCDLIHVDAAHDYDSVVADIRTWWAIVRPGGIMMGDDYITSWPGVIRAVDEFAKANQLKLNIDKNKWWVQKPV